MCIRDSHPYFTVKDTFYVGCFLIIAAFIIFFAPTFGGWFLEHDNFTAVSYTHLDVYKRQVSGRIEPGGLAKSRRIVGALRLPLHFPVFCGRPALSRQLQCVCPCLLYTSRCV